MQINALWRLLAWSLTATIGFGSGVVVGASQGWLQPIVTLTVVNQTGSTLSEIEIRYQGSRQTGSLHLPGMLDKQRTVARFYLPGEGGYVVVGRLSDGRVASQGEGYVEAGYSAMEVLLPPEAPELAQPGARQ